MSQDEKRAVGRALLSVSDKNDLVPFAKQLAEFGIDLVSTGGTSSALKDAGLSVRDVADLTQFPEMMDGRVKTLHPRIHGGLLAKRNNTEHVRAMDEHGIEPIDLLVVNLYPFEQTVESGADFETCIENIDIGGPALIRAAAKNHDDVLVVTSPEDYEAVLAELQANDGCTSLSFRRQMAAKAYARTAAYDAAISSWFAREQGVDFPERITVSARLRQTLRYGENPHQSAAFYTFARPGPGVASAEQLQGKELSYNNINDTDAAFELVSEFGDWGQPAVAIIKHANPCGVAMGSTLTEAYQKALACDPVSAFGGIVAVNRPLTAEAAEEIAKIFTEVVIAPGADEGATEIFAKKKNLRLLLTQATADMSQVSSTVRMVSGGLLVQSKDTGQVHKLRSKLEVVTKRQPSDQEMEDMVFAFTVAKHVKSNAIVYAKDGATVGIGAGQMSRVDSSRIAARKAEDAAEAAGLAEPLTRGSAVASDAFFPFADGLLAAAEAGATAVIQPGGSIRDDEVIAAADEANLTMVLTGMRHFRH